MSSFILCPPLSDISNPKSVVSQQFSANYWLTYMGKANIKFTHHHWNLHLLCSLNGPTCLWPAGARPSPAGPLFPELFWTQREAREKVTRDHINTGMQRFTKSDIRTDKWAIYYLLSIIALLPSNGGRMFCPCEQMAVLTSDSGEALWLFP